MTSPLTDQHRTAPKRHCGKVPKCPAWCSNPAAIVRLALWMTDNGYERREIERMGVSPWLYEVEHLQADLEAGIAICAEAAAERRRG